MISAVRFAGGADTYAAPLPIWTRRFMFAPGLNVVCGLNGCGKTTLLKLLGGLTGLHGMRASHASGLPDVGFDQVGREDAPWTLGGYTNLVARRALGARRDAERPRSRAEADARVAEARRDPVRVDLAWDRGPTALFAGRDAFARPASLGETGDVGAELTRVYNARVLSSGQAVAAQVEAVLAGLLSATPLRFGAVRGVNSLWMARAAAWDRWFDHGATPGAAGTPTLLMDEPDLSLSPLAQVGFWRVLEALAVRHDVQVIAVSHSPFALLHGHAVEVTPGFRAKVVEAVQTVAARARGEGVNPEAGGLPPAPASAAAPRSRGGRRPPASR